MIKEGKHDPAVCLLKFSLQEKIDDKRKKNDSRFIVKNKYKKQLNNIKLNRNLLFFLYN